MAGSTPALESQDGDGAAREERGRLRRTFAPFLRNWRAPLSLRRPSAFAWGVAVICVAVLLIAGFTYYGSRQFTRRAAEQRAATEAKSLAEYSAYVATGDAFNGYLQILRYAEDPVVRAPGSPRDARDAALQQLIYLNTNKFASLAVADRSGLVLATTDPSIVSVLDSGAFKQTRADLDPANSDIILPEAGRTGYVEFTAPIRDVGGETWAIIYGRAEPDRLWGGTLRAGVDGSRNVIINNEGQFSAGVPDELLTLPWKGAPLENGSVAADIAGVPSICGLGAIGRDTQIDHGWNVAACLPTSLIQAEAGQALGKQSLVTLAAAVLAVVLASGLLRLALDGGPTRAASAEPEAEPAPTTESDTSYSELAELVARHVPTPVSDDAVEAADATEAEVEPPPGSEEEPPAPPAPTIVADVNALTLIEAYERRSARLGEHLRDAVQARLLIAAAQADEAYRLRPNEPERAALLHTRAIAELDDVRERILRAFGQELYPGLVRLGLPGALRALVKELTDEIEVTLEVGPNVDRIGTERSLDPLQRIVTYRAVRDAIHGIATADAAGCTVAVTRVGEALNITVAAQHAAEPLDEHALSAAELSIRAYGGTIRIQRWGERLLITMEIPATNTNVARQADCEPARDDEAAEPPPDADGGDGEMDEVEVKVVQVQTVALADNPEDHPAPAQEAIDVAQPAPKNAAAPQPAADTGETAA